MEPNSYHDRGDDNYYKAEDGIESALSARGRKDSSYLYRDQMNTRAGLQNVLQLFVTNAANVFLLEVSPEYPILLEEQVEMCKRVLNIYRFMVMNVKMDGRTWEQLLFILLQITQLTLTETPPRRREDTLGGRLAQAIFQTLIVTWIKANLYVVVSCELWDQFQEVLSSLTLWEELIREWYKTMETLTRVLARQVYNLDLNDLPLDRLSEQKAKKRRGKTGMPPPKISTTSVTTVESESCKKEGEPTVNGGQAPHPAFRPGVPVPGSPYPDHRDRLSSTSEHSDVRRTVQSSRSRHRHYVKQRSKSDGCINFSRYPDAEMMEAESWRLRQQLSRSLDSLELAKYQSRSPSPAPSSSMESHSIKDSPVLLDNEDHVSEGAFSEVGELTGGLSQSGSAGGQPRSVMAGGSVKGWLPDVAVVLWRRMLGSLGDVNSIADTVIHAQIYKYLIELYDIMVKIRNNQGVSVDNLSTPPPPEYVPPFTIFAPWCFRALILPDTYQRGKLYALRLLCLLTIRPQDSPLPKTHLVQYYKVLHTGLTSGDPETLYNIVRFTGPRFFSLALPGYSLYLFDYLAAANTIISSQELKGVPRTEAVSIVGSLLSYPSMLPSLNLLLPAPDQLSLVNSKDLQDQVIAVLLKAGKKEPVGLARCIALCSLGMFVYRELVHETYHPKLKEAITVLLAALKFNNKAVAQVASDMLMLLSEQVDKLLVYHPDLPRKIVEVLSRSLSCLLPRPDTSSQITAEDRRLLLSLLACLGEWCMKLPLRALTQVQEDSRSLLHHVFEALLTGVNTGNKAVSSPVGNIDKDFDPDIHDDNLKGEVWNMSSPAKIKSRSQSRELLDGVNIPLIQDSGPGGVVQLAARTILSHLVNHLHHFPQAIGASSLSSQVSEHDDVPTLLGEQDLSLDTFQSPNIQLFVLNNTTLLSLVEIPSLDPIGEFNTASSQVRVILRDISGKFSWDASILYSPAAEGVAPAPDNGDTVTWSQVSSSSVMSPPRHTIRHRPPSELPTHETAAPDLDQLDDMLQYLGHTSPELLSVPGQSLNSLSAWAGIDKDVESDIISSVISQRNMDQDHLARQNYQPHRCQAKSVTPPEAQSSYDHHNQPFQLARILFQQLGLSAWDKRPHIHLVTKNEQLVRELKHLDTQRGRETHKIAVIYVAEGQEDKISILSNTSGSEAFEEFVAGLGWEVELETHNGFMGGLSRNRAVTGETAPYYATSFVETMYHVSTRMPSTSEESMLQKTRHLGNDEIHIVWTEHWRDYRRGIIPTEFCDVLIVIYPLNNNLYRIQVS